MKSKRQTSKFDHLSLEELLETVNLEGESKKPNVRIEKVEEVKMNPIIVDDLPPVYKKEELRMKRDKQKFTPVFNNAPIKPISSKKPKEEELSNLILNLNKGQNIQAEKHKEPALRQKIFEQDKCYNKKKPKDTNKKTQRTSQHHPSDKFSVLFSQSMVFKNVQVSLRFGDYKIYEEKIRQRTALVVPFVDSRFHTYLVNDIRKRTNGDYEAIFGQFLDRKNQSSFRTGQIITFPEIHHKAYEKIYFVKAIHNQGLIEYNKKSLYECFYALIIKSDQESIQSLVIGDWVWGKLQMVDIADKMLNGLIEGIRKLRNTKELKEISLCFGTKSDYRIFSQSFRTICDVYIETFY